VIRTDEIVDEIRAAREAYAARFDFDLHRLFADLQSKEAKHQADISSLKPVPRRKPSLSS
jgi:hypothetical protein